MTRGVFCLFCGCPISLRPRLESLLQSRRKEARVASQSGVIVLQCETCCKDAPYPIKEVVPLDGPEPLSASGGPRYRRAVGGE